MISKIRSLFWLPILLAILACAIFSPSVHQEPSSTPAIKYYPGTPTPNLPPTNTPFPTEAVTPTSPLPTPTVSLVSVSTPTPTLIPLDTQLRIFEDLWSIVNDTYVYADFNGLDWTPIHQEYSEKISAGLTNSQFYLALNEVISQLSDDHSQFL